MLLEEYEYLQYQLEEVFTIEDLVNQIPKAKKLLEIKGIGMKTASSVLCISCENVRYNPQKMLTDIARSLMMYSFIQTLRQSLS